MPPLRTYIPSAAVLRVLSRPSTPRCPLLSLQFTRGKRKASRPAVDPETQSDRQMKVLLKQARGEAKIRQDEIEKRGRLPTDTMDDMGLPEIEYWEQDLDRPGKPMTLIKKMETRADLERQEKIDAMREERDRNPNYDDAELNKMLIDDLCRNPAFADLTEALQSLKETIISKEEKAQMERDADKELEPSEKEFEAIARTNIDRALQELLDDPDLVEYQKDVREVRKLLPESGDIDTPEFVAAMEALEAKLETNPVYQAKLEKWRAEQEADDSTSAELRDLEAQIEQIDAESKESEEELNSYNTNLEPGSDVPENVDELLVQMRELLGAMNDDKSKEINSEIDALMREDPVSEDESEGNDKEFDLDYLANEIDKIQKNPPPITSATEAEIVDPALEAKVDEIMKDPRLLEKLAYITRVIKAQKPSLINPDIESAPDPLTLSDSETTTLQAQLKIAENTPEHIAALRRLRVNLVPPFHVSPALRSFNQALKIAYCCSNDAVRRVLWRSYFKARSLPTFLQNMTDDAWDLMYYSQAVTWVGNDNRTNHLRIILRDMKSVGRNGPPTHPDSLRKSK